MKEALTGTAIVAVSTLLEAVRKRLLMVSVVFSVVLVGLSVAAASVSIGEKGRLIIDVGLAAASGLGSAIALALAISSFAGEIRSRTAYPVLARPVQRWVFVLGKYLGNVAAMVLVVTIMLLATATIVWLYGGHVGEAFWSSLWLTWMEMALVVSIALLFSTMASPTLAATYSVGIVLAGNLAGDILAIADRMQDKGKALGSVLRYAYYVVPDLQELSLRTQAANDLPAPSRFLLYGTLYALAYAACAVVIAMWIFSRRRAV